MVGRMFLGFVLALLIKPALAEDIVFSPVTAGQWERIEPALSPQLSMEKIEVAPVSLRMD